MQAARGAKKKVQESNTAMIQGLFGGGNIDHEADHQRLLHQQKKKTITTAHDMSGATASNVLDILDEYTLDEYKMIFSALDEDDSGEITVKEMASAFRTMGLSLTNIEIRDLVLSVDKDSNGLIDLGEFCLMLYQVSTGTASKTHFINRKHSTQKVPKPPCCTTNFPKIDKQRRRLWRFCDDPISSPLARFASTSIMVLIVISCVAFVWETDLNYHQRNTQFWFALEAFCTACFTVEYLCRIFSTPHLFHFLYDLMNTIDLVAIAPFYIELALATDNGDGTGFNSQSLRAFRLFRVFRLFKIGRHISWLQVFSDTYIASFPPLIMIIFIMSIIMVFIASLAHTIEAPVFDQNAGVWTQSNGKVAVIQSIPDGFWYTIVTLTTVGYGDISMETPLGRILAIFTSMTGIMVLAIPISVISLNFHDKYEANERIQQQRTESAIRLKKLKMEMEKNKNRGVVKPRLESGENKIRTVVGLLHASADRCILSMKTSIANSLLAEEQNRLDMKHEFKSMLGQWEPATRRDLLRKTKNLQESISDKEAGNI
jgi:voltage-gated potassium channel Kch